MEKHVNVGRNRRWKQRMEKRPKGNHPLPLLNLPVSKALYFIDVTSDLVEYRGEETEVYNNPVKC